MSFRFFTENQKDMHASLIEFLTYFPEKEIWRFFVERSRYQFNEELYRRLYKILNPDSEDIPPVNEIREWLNKQNMTVQALYDFAEKNSKKDQLLHELNNDLKLGNKKHLSLTNAIDKQQAWEGFEETEPNYLMGVVNGFNFLLNAVSKNHELSLKFIKELHQICTNQVFGMREENLPGAFRDDIVRWRFDPEVNSIDGMVDIIDYLKTIYVGGKWWSGSNIFGLEIVNKPDDPVKKLQVLEMSDFIEIQNTREYVESLFQEKERKEIMFEATETCAMSEETIPSFLDEIGEDQIIKLNSDLANAHTKEEKLTAIFTYLKYAVLHHPFHDGVGRTYSMLLLQFLLLKENLLPVMMPDSNVIPGLSIKELVNIYLRSEQEMKLIFKNSKYVSSEAFAAFADPNDETEVAKATKPNIDTEALLKQLSAKEIGYFENCIQTFTDTKKEILKELHRLDISEDNDLSHNQQLKTP